MFLSDKARKLLISNADSIQQEIDSFFISASNSKTKKIIYPPKEINNLTKPDINYK